MLECAHLLHIIYFKPYTFRRWLYKLDPEIDMTNDPFDPRFRSRWAQNPRLRRYAWQIWWLTLCGPGIITASVGIVLDVATRSFYWNWVSLAIIAWGIGLLLKAAVAATRRTRVLLGIATLIALTTAIINIMTTREEPVSTDMIIETSIVSGIVWGTLGGVMWGVAYGMLVGGALSIVMGVLFGGMLGMPLMWVVHGIEIGVLTGTVLSMAFALASVAGVWRVPFWLPESIWSVFLFLWIRLGAGNPVEALGILPQRFDELIRLPLPFVGQIILEAYRDDPGAAAETVRYLFDSTNQQKLAAKVTAAIALDSLLRCNNIGDIADIADTLDWVPQPPPEELGEALPLFLEVAQDVRAALESDSFYRRAELLRAAIRRLESGRIGLSYPISFPIYYESSVRRLESGRLRLGAGRHGARFAQAVGGWQSILEEALRTAEERARKAGEIPQVYIAGSSLTPDKAGERFKGRRDIFREVGRLAVEVPKPTLLLHGGRRVGKSSVLNYLHHHLGSDIVPVVADGHKLGEVAATLDGFASALAEEILEGARKSRNMRLPRPPDFAESGEPLLALMRWMEEIAAGTGGKTFLLCLDEYERLEELVGKTGDKAPLGFLRHLIQSVPNWTVLLSGSHVFSELSPYWYDYLINVQAIHVSYLDEPDARELIVHPVSDFPDVYEPEAVEKILHLTRCHPYLIQLLCSQVVKLLNREKRKRATPDDVEAALPWAFERGDGFFRELWQHQMNDAERALLRAIASGGEPPEPPEGIVRRLIRLEVLEATAEGYRFQVPMIGRWVAEIGAKEM